MSTSNTPVLPATSVLVDKQSVNLADNLLSLYIPVVRVQEDRGHRFALIVAHRL